MNAANTLLQLFLTLFREGGWVLWPIFGVSVLAWHIGFGKLVFLRKLKRARDRFIMAMETAHPLPPDATTSGCAPYDALLNEMRRTDGSALRIDFAFREFLANVIPDLEQGFSTMSACVSTAPLLGLLGTISGMNRMFSVITDVGLGSPGLMAGGISIALESALTGLTVAVAAMFFHNYLFNKKSIFVHALMKDGERLVGRRDQRHV